MPEITGIATIDIEVRCAVCNEGLCKLSEYKDGTLFVHPCPDCLRKAQEEAGVAP
jgi:hypothetical protein